MLRKTDLRGGGGLTGIDRCERARERERKRGMRGKHKEGGVDEGVSNYS